MIMMMEAFASQHNPAVRVDVDYDVEPAAWSGLQCRPADTRL